MMGYTIKGLAFMYGFMATRDLHDPGMDADWDENEAEYTRKIMAVLDKPGNEKVRAQVLKDSA